MERAAQTIIDSGIETVVVVSPHTPRHRQAYGYVVGETLHGDFHAFGIRGLEASFKADAAAVATIARHVERTGLLAAPANVQNLDHGAMVPLWFLRQAGFHGRVAVLGFPWDNEPGRCQRFGTAVATAMDSMERSWGLLASGDMSHALRPGAPGGFHPRAHLFDEQVVSCVKAGRLADLSGIESDLRSLAAEDVVDSLAIAEGVLGMDHPGQCVLSYEAPFGVGYLVAILKGPASRTPAESPP
jgi:aromatic ring-opening dioxygenase LigB subunit